MIFDTKLKEMCHYGQYDEMQLVPCYLIFFCPLYLAEDLLEKFSSLGPTAIYTEIMSLGPDNNMDSLEPLTKFIEMLHLLMKTRRHFEVLQAYLSKCLEVGKYVKNDGGES